jgi:hypothetical protein
MSNQLINQFIKEFEKEVHQEELRKGGVLEVGVVEEIKDGVINASGLDNAGFGELVTFETGVNGMIIDMTETTVGIVVLGEYENILAGSSSSSDLAVAGYQVEANRMFRTKYSGMQPNQNNGSTNGSANGYSNGSSNTVQFDQYGNIINGSSTTNGSYNSNGGSQGSYNSNGSYNANGSMNGGVNINGNGNGSNNGQVMYDANGNIISGGNNGNGTSGNSSSRSSSSTNTGNRSAYSYVAGCDYSVLGSLGMSATCGDNGYLFPGLVGGQCPVSACMFNVDQGGDTPFGPL